MTGAPAEMWRKFRFVTAPGWAYAFLLLVCTGIGLLLIFVIMRLVSRVASGHLPLTRAASNQIRNANIAGLALAVVWLLLWAVAFALGDSSAAGALFVLGFLVLFAAIVYWLLVRPRFQISGKVLAVQPGQRESIVLLERVHPAFVAAVQAQQQARAAQ